MNGLSLSLLFFITMKLWDLTYKPEKLYVSEDMIRAELSDSAYSVGAGNWTFTKDTNLKIVDTKFSSFENILFIKFKDKRTLELADPKFSGALEEKQTKLAKLNVDGLIKMVYVSIEGKPVCTLISVVEFKAKKDNIE
jgi:hypothetical protein